MRTAAAASPTGKFDEDGMNRLHLCISVLTIASLPGHAGAAEALPPTLRACMSESDDARRLSCFDRESARLAGDQRAAAAPVAAAPPSPPVAASAATPAAPDTSPEEKFGYRGSIAREEFDRRQAEERKFEQLTAKITELGTLPRGELLLTLDNGQVWAQKAADRALRLKVGDEVTIKRASLGSFLLTTAANGSMRVTRIR
jgi:hypothetical protein